jgi:FkbM family methyltransferase
MLNIKKLIHKFIYSVKNESFLLALKKTFIWFYLNFIQLKKINRTKPIDKSYSDSLQKVFRKPARPNAFVITNTNYGAMIVNRYDYGLTKDNEGYGVGYHLLNSSEFDFDEVNLVINLLLNRKAYFGDGVVAIDCGANIGIHTINWAAIMFGWGEVIAFEAQERIYYALTGNIALNNCFNAKAILAAVGEESGEMLIPKPNYLSPASFGSLELRLKDNTEFIGQQIDYSEEGCVKIKMVKIDDLDLSRLDFIKIDIEGMEIDALMGAKMSIKKFKPQMLIERIKSNETKLLDFLQNLDYQIFSVGFNLLAIHKKDPVLNHIESILK